MQKTSSTNIDPILEYLLEFNQKNAIEYSDRYLIPVGGLAKMLEDFKGFHLNKVVVIKSELSPPPETEDINTLMEML
jgi:hypothetical protein